MFIKHLGKDPEFGSISPIETVCSEVDPPSWMDKSFCWGLFSNLTFSEDARDFKLLYTSSVNQRLLLHFKGHIFYPPHNTQRLRNL